MRILPIITAVAVSFLSVACSTPAPPPGVTVVTPFDVQRYLGTGTKSPASTILLKAGLKRSRSPGSRVMTAVWTWSIKAITPTATCGRKRTGWRILPANPAAPR